MAGVAADGCFSNAEKRPISHSVTLCLMSTCTVLNYGHYIIVRFDDGEQVGNIFSPVLIHDRGMMLAAFFDFCILFFCAAASLSVVVSDNPIRSDGLAQI